eukprot:6206125-Pleurochrysis_carterae.AAC.6
MPSAARTTGPCGEFLYFAHTLDNELECAVNHSRRGGGSPVLKKGERGWPDRRCQHVKNMRVKADCPQQHTERGLVDSKGHSAHVTVAMMPSEPKPARIALRSFPPASAPRSDHSL